MKKLIPEKQVIRFLLVLIFILSLAAGYYQVQWELEQKRYKRIEDLYVRVRSELGRDATQELIDRSYENEQ